MKKIRKAFTITELVIVIAVIAILAAVLIPTFTNVIRRAKISSDTQTVASLNTALSAYAVDHAVDSEEDLRAVFDGTYGEGFYDSLRPESAQYGYHYWYDTRSGRLELSRSGDLAEGETASAQSFASLAFAEGGAPSFAGAGLRASLKEGYVLLDKGGSAVADTLSALDTLADAEDYLSALQKAGKLGTEDASLQEPLHAALQSTAILTDAGAFRFAGESAVQLQIAPNVTKLSGALYIYDESAGEVTQTQAGEAQPVVYAAEGRFVLPENVSLVDSYALYFAGGNAVFLEVPAEADMMHLFSANGTNATIVRAGDSAAYTISGGTIYANGQPLEGSLAITHAVRSFEIGVMGGENLGGTYSVALDAISGPLAMYAYNFVAEDGGTLVSDSRVSWAIESQPGGAGAKIDENGVITDIAAGETVIKATSVQNPDISARFTIRIGAILSGNVFLEKDGLQEAAVFDETNLCSVPVMTGGESASYTFHITPILNFEDIACKDEYTLQIVEGEEIASFTGDVLTLPVNGKVVVKLTFDFYSSSEWYFQFTCISKIFDYDKKVEYYRFGTENAVPIAYAQDADLSAIKITYNVLKNQSYNASVFISEDKKLLEFGGGGKVEINAVAGDEIIDQFTVQIINGAVNVSDKNQFVANQSMCLTNDITKDNGTISVAQGCYLYGNGYTIRADKSSFNSNNSQFITLAGTMDNVSVIGVAVDDFYTGDGHEYYQTATTVYIKTSGAAIYNSYIENGKYAVRLDEISGRVDLKNMIVVGGAISVGITAPASQADVYFENIKIVQKQGAEFIGAGIAFYEGGAEKVTLHFSGVENMLQNFAAESTISQFPSDYQTLLREVWNREEFARFQYSYNGEKTEKGVYMHLGILALLDGEDKKPAIQIDEGCNLYGKMSSEVITAGIGFAKATGMVYAFDSSLAQAYVQENLESWLTAVPAKAFAYEPLEAEIKIYNSQIRAELSSYDAQINCKEVIYDNISAAKYGADLEVSVQIEKIGGAGDYLGNYEFKGIGEYKITYTVKDRFEIDHIGNPLEYTAGTALLYVSPKMEPPTIKFNSGEKLNQNGISNPSGLDLTDVEYQKEAGKTGYLLDYDPKYEINILNYFGLEIITYDGQDLVKVSPESIAVTINGQGYSDWMQNITLSDGSNDLPGNSSSKDCRYVNIFTIKISAVYQGLTQEKTVKLTFYVPKLSGLFGGKW